MKTLLCMELDNISPEQMKIFRSYFSGRQDVYGTMTPKGPICVREALTDDILLKHFSGETRVGLYGIQPGNTVQWAVVDVDEDKDLPKDQAAIKAQEEATKAYVACLENNLFCYLERSKKRGFHIWSFFDEPIPVKDVRKALGKILEDAHLDCEIFPKQDSVTSNNGVGNFIFLPFHGGSAKEKRTLFLNSQFQPYEDQWEHLAKIYRTKAENIRSMAEEIQEEITEDASHGTQDSTSEDSLDLVKYLNHYGVSFRIKKDTNRTFYLLNRCLFADNHTTKDNLGDSAIVQSASGKMTYQCFHHHCQDNTWKDARKKISGNDSLDKFCKRDGTQNHIELVSEDITAFIKRPILNPEALIDGGIFPSKGQLIVGGHSKQGKSILLDNIALNLSTGTALFGQFSIPKKRRGIIFQAEISEVSQQDRFRKMVLAMNVKPQPGYLSVVNRKGLNINKQKDFDEICRKIEECDAEYVFFDPMFRFHVGDENKSSEMKNFFSRLDEMTTKLSVAIGLIHHFGKPTEYEREGAQQLRGSSTIFDYGDSYLSLKRQSRNKPKEYLKIFFELRNAEDPEPLFLWRNPESLWYEVQAVETASSVSDHDIIKLAQSMDGRVMRSDLIKILKNDFNISERTAIRTIDQTKHLFIEEKLKIKGSPVRFILKPDLMPNHLKPLA